MSKKKTTREFICEADIISAHSGRYDYSKVEYVSAHDKVVITCLVHGDFTQTPNSHLRGHGCPSCKRDSARIRNIGTTEMFIEKSRIVHGELYDYDFVTYVDYDTLVQIGCRIHGLFEQTPDSHHQGAGCQKCGVIKNRKVVSKPAKLWLDTIGVPDDLDHREVAGLLPGQRYTVDGYDPHTKTIYEFYGDYWHGNPTRYDPGDTNLVVKKTFGALYDETLLRRQKFIDTGYTVVEMWESEWEELHLSSAAAPTDIEIVPFFTDEEIRVGSLV